MTKMLRVGTGYTRVLYWVRCILWVSGIYLCMTKMFRVGTGYIRVSTGYGVCPRCWHLPWYDQDIPGMYRVYTRVCTGCDAGIFSIVTKVSRVGTGYTRVSTCCDAGIYSVVTKIFRVVTGYTTRVPHVEYMFYSTRPWNTLYVGHRSPIPTFVI